MSSARKKTPLLGRPPLKKSERSVMTAMRLAPAARSEIAQLARKWKVSRTAVVERAANEAYGRAIFGPGYISPLDPAHPRHSANGKAD